MANDIPRPEKILLAMYHLTGGTTASVEYEDIVVKSWQLFPDDFGLRKYSHQYPDSSDQHKPLYGPLKTRGFVRSGNKTFRLTDKGLEYAEKLDSVLKGKISFSEAAGGDSQGGRLSRNKQEQLNRILQTEAFRLFSEGSKESILDTDFYTYLGVTVRTDKNEFLGRLNTVADAVQDGERLKADQRSGQIAELHRYLVEKFAATIASKTKSS